MLKRLHENPQVYMGGGYDNKHRMAHERYELRDKKYFRDFFDRYSMEKINNETNLIGPGGKVLKQVIGFKQPEVIRAPDAFLPNVVNLFPAIDMIVSVRHPVLHFESFYNYKLRFADPDKGLKLPDSKKLIGHCSLVCENRPRDPHCTPQLEYIKKEVIDGIEQAPTKGRSSACTMLSAYHHALSRLALTPMTDERELNLLADPFHQSSIHPEWSGRLFLMEMGQITDNDTKRHDEFERSFEDFLGLEANSFTTKATEGDKVKYTKSPKFIHICDEKHRKIRKKLVDIGRKSSRWIKDYLLKSDRVVVHDKDHFVELIEKWESDPCE